MRSLTSKRICTRDDKTSQFEDDKMYLVLDPQLRPLQPDITSEESMKIFDQHKEKAKEYLKLENKLAYTSLRHRQLSEELSRHYKAESYQQQDEKQQLEDEKESLIKLRRTLQQKLHRQQSSKHVQVSG